MKKGREEGRKGGGGGGEGRERRKGIKERMENRDQT